jgi:hypothetical protein
VLSAECEKRLTVEKYMGMSFDPPMRLLEIMSRNVVTLSGSRSLEFLVPGSCKETFDWDFYVKKDPGHILNFVAGTCFTGI